MIGNFRRPSRAAVRHRDLYGLIIDRARFHFELASVACRHGLHGIAHQVDENLLDLSPVDTHAGSMRVEAVMDLDSERPVHGQRQRARIFDHGDNVFYTLLSLAASEEITQASNDLTGPQGLFDGVAHGFSDFSVRLVAVI